MFKIVNQSKTPVTRDKFITVAGNVGAGKSTLTKLVGEKLGFETHYEKVDGNPYLEDFYTSTGYQGKCIGRFSGRIDKGVCEIAGKKYQLDINWNGISALHGGFNGIAFQNFLFLFLYQL